jgi:hypothetical protein
MWIKIYYVYESGRNVFHRNTLNVSINDSAIVKFQNRITFAVFIYSDMMSESSSTKYN